MARPVPKVLRILLVLAILVNSIYLSSYLIFNSGTSLVEILPSDSGRHVSINYDDIQEESSTPNFGLEIAKLMKSVAENTDKYWKADTTLKSTSVKITPEEFLSDAKESSAWRNKNTLFYDVRLTLSLYVSYIRNRFAEQTAPEEVTVPFHWADWVDLTFLNENELSKPLSKRKKCRYLRAYSEGTNGISKQELQCDDNHDVSDQDVIQYGFDKREQLPGYIVKGHCGKRAYIDTRIAQARSYLLTHMPNPFKIIFLHGDKGTYEVNVEQQSRTRIVNSQLMEAYLKDNGNLKPRKKLTLDPTSEFKRLTQTSASQVLRPEDDIFSIYNNTHSYDVTTSKNIDIPKDTFKYSADNVHDQIQSLTQLRKDQPLTTLQENYLQSLNYSSQLDTNHEWIFFRQATLRNNGVDDDNVDKDPGFHYDWRFFVGSLNGKRPGWTNEDLNFRQKVILDRMLRTWFRFAHEKGLVSWIMHGPLLSWYWNGLMFPFDNDIDIQMPIKELARLGELYNQTLVVEDLEEGYGKYLIDVGTFIHNRDISRRENHIDARFIDVDSGLYIDITGLSTSEVKSPGDAEKYGVVKTAENQDSIYNDRRKHWYRHDQLSPMKLSLLGGVPVYVPSEIAGRLLVEYKTGITKPEYSKWHFVPRLRLWIHSDKLTQLFDENDFRAMSGDKPEEVDSGKIAALVLDMNDEQILTLLKADEDTLIEYFKTREITELHEKEMRYLFSMVGDETKEGDNYSPEKLVIQDKIPVGDELAEYNKLVTENMKIKTPLKRSFFQYEYYDQKSHRA